MTSIPHNVQIHAGYTTGSHKGKNVEVQAHQNGNNMVGSTISCNPVRDMTQIMNTGNIFYLEYGLYLHMIYDACTLLGYGLETARSVIQYPWSASFNKMSSSFKLSDHDKVYRVLSFLRTAINHPIRVITGSVQDIVAAKGSRETILTFHHTLSLDLTALLSGGPRLEFHIFRPKTINKDDFESVMRCKISECLDLTTEEVSLVLNYSIPSCLIRSLRSTDEMLNWSYSYTGQRCESSKSDPSLNWEPLQKFS
jgi:hypothetical protein